MDEEKVRRTIEKIREAKETGNWGPINQELLEKRIRWFEENFDNLNLEGTDVRIAYKLILLKMEIDPKDIPVIYEDERKIVWRSYNWCPILEACRQGGFDTREVCRKGWESSVQSLVEMVNPTLRFSRSYEKIRPHADYCEETIELAE